MGREVMKRKRREGIKFRNATLADVGISNEMYALTKHTYDHVVYNASKPWFIIYYQPTWKQDNQQRRNIH
jgi:hypothetical protein